MPVAMQTIARAKALAYGAAAAAMRGTWMRRLCVQRPVAYRGKHCGAGHRSGEM
jgi:hypothetical protein